MFLLIVMYQRTVTIYRYVRNFKSPPPGPEKGLLLSEFFYAA
jgi:hypothetical protein